MGLSLTLIPMILTFPGSSFDLATFLKHLFSDRLCLIEF